MGCVLKCERCGKSFAYDSSEMENGGTEWHPTWNSHCKKCGCIISFESGAIDIFDRPPLPNERDASERAKSSDMREYWIQEYFKENYHDLGFTKLEGPFEIGPDFRGTYKQKPVLVEVERDCESYLRHNHHLNERFSKVKILVVLTPPDPEIASRVLLPKTILPIDIDAFVDWWRPKAALYSKNKRITTIIRMISREFQRRYGVDCQDKERDMSTCPDCDSCAYFGEGIFSEAQELFHDLALKFIAMYKHPIMSENFRLTEIEPTEIDEFYLTEVLNAVQ